MDLRTYLRDVPDFPKPGILFKDITPLLADGPALRHAVDALAEGVKTWQPDIIAAAEARGFLMAAPLAVALGCGLVPIRKRGKLPYATLDIEYELEYGTDSLHVHTDALKAGARVLLVDDVLATGGTIKACRDLVLSTGAEVIGCAFLLELAFLEGRTRLGEMPVHSVMVV